MRLPIVSPITVRLPQLLTRNPENYPAPRLAAPRARYSWRVRAANAYSLGDDRHTFGGVLCIKEMPLAAPSTLVCGS